MSHRARTLIAKLIARTRGQEGFALPTTLLMVSVATAAVGVGVMSSMRVQHGVIRDQGTKSAVQVAEAGVDDALLHYNRVLPSGSNPCAPVTSSTATNGWCGPVTGSINGNPWTYYVRPFGGTTNGIEVVSSSTVNGATRRVDVLAQSSSSAQIFAQALVQAQNQIHLDQNATVNASTATNGSVALDSNATICGNLSYGVGQTLTITGNAQQTCGARTQAPLYLPPVNQGDAPTNNNNANFFGIDRVSGNKGDACFNGRTALGTIGSCRPRELSISGNSSVTLNGSRYSFCKLTMTSNSSLYIASGHEVLIYFDSPEACGISNGGTQLYMESNTRITANAGGAVNVRLLFVGSDAIRTNIVLNSNTSIRAACTQNFIIYAPLTDITLNSNSVFCGGLAGRSVEMASNSTVYTDSAAQSWILPGTPPHYAVSRYVECNSTSATGAPNSGC